MKNDDKRWYVTWDDQRFGPYLEEELIDRVRNDKVDISAYVFCEGMKNWEPISTHPEFSAAFSYIPPSPTKLKFEPPTNVKVSQSVKTYHRFSFMRFLFVVLFGVAGYAGSLFLYESRLLVLGNSDGYAIAGIIIGFILGMILFRPFKKRFRQGSTNSEVDSMSSKHHFPFFTILGILLALAGLYGTFIVYEPNQWQVMIRSYPSGKEHTHNLRFKYEANCKQWIRDEASKYTQMNNDHPGLYPLKLYACRRFCPNKFECTLRMLQGQ